MKESTDTLIRQWEMLRRIPKAPIKITAGALCDFLKSINYPVSKRTVERDLVTLSSFFPIEQDDRSKPYGWSWMRDAASFSIPGLDQNESLTLALAEQYLLSLMPTSTIEVLRPYFQSAKKNLIKENSSKTRSWLDKVAAIQPNQPLIAPKIDRDVHHIVSTALLNEKQLTISYQKKGDAESIDYTIHPLAMIQRGGIIYLEVRFFDYEDTRLLAMHRIKKAIPLDLPSIYPENFSLQNEIKNGRFGFGDGEIITLELELNKFIAEYIYETPLSEDQKITEINADLINLKATVPNNGQLKWWILSLGDGVKVVSPETLSKDIKATLINALNLYQDTN